MVIVVDIDGTICKTDNADYENSTPIKKNIEKINQLYDDDNTIIYFTARGSKTGICWRETTERQLCEWGCKYHELKLKKMFYDKWIDDKAFNSEDYFNEK